MSRAWLLALLAPMTAFAGEQIRPIGDFKTLYSKGIYELRVTVGEAPSLKLSGDAKDLDKIEVTLDRDELHINDKRSRSLFHVSVNEETIKIDVTVPALAAFNGDGVGQTIINGVSGEVDATGALQCQREGQHADDQNQTLPVDRGISAVEIDTAQQTHQQAADQSRMHVGHHATHHHADGECQHRQRQDPEKQRRGDLQRESFFVAVRRTLRAGARKGRDRCECDAGPGGDQPDDGREQGRTPGHDA